jgi:hypothetical protein
MLTHISGAQINYAFGRVEQPRISIPLISCGCYSAIFTGECDHCGAGLCTGYRLLLGTFIGVACKLTAQFSR